MSERIREYELLYPLGKGGMGQIYRARHVLLDSACAVKVIRRELVADAELRSRFLREALILRRLNASPFIVNCETVFEEKEQLYLVMELLEGETLGARMKRLAPSWQRDRRILLQMVEAVAFAHRLDTSILHRDIKPSNIFILKDESVKVLDFGLAKQLALEMEDVTATGQMIGTPAYMPPEVLKGEMNIRDVGPEGDVYALGVLAYRLFTGRLPYDLREDMTSLDTLTHLTKAHLLGAALMPLVRLCPDLPAGLSSAIMAALESDPARRPKDAAELMKRLQDPLQIQAASASRKDEDETSDQTLVKNLPKFGKVGSKAQLTSLDEKPATPATEPPPPILVKKEPTTVLAAKKNLALIAVGVFASLIIGGGAYFLRGGSSGEQKPAAPITAVAPHQEPGTKNPFDEVYGKVEINRDGRFIAYKNGTVLDTKTNLMWAAKDNGSDIDWQNAKSYCDNYRVAGYTDWRMPTQDELAGLYDTKARGKNGYHLTKLIELTSGCLWALETSRPTAPFGGLNFGNGLYDPWSKQVLPVRSGK